MNRKKKQHPHSKNLKEIKTAPSSENRFQVFGDFEAFEKPKEHREVQPSSEKAGSNHLQKKLNPISQAEISVEGAVHTAAVPKVVVDLHSPLKEPEQETREKSQLPKAKQENTQADPEIVTSIQVAYP